VIVLLLLLLVVAIAVPFVVDVVLGVYEVNAGAVVIAAQGGKSVREDGRVDV
jgi:hypothetical protein